MEQLVRQSYHQSTHGWFRNRKEVSEHVYCEEGDRKGYSEAGVWPWLIL